MRRLLTGATGCLRLQPFMRRHVTGGGETLDYSESMQILRTAAHTLPQKLRPFAQLKRPGLLASSPPSPPARIDQATRLTIHRAVGISRLRSLLTSFRFKHTTSHRPRVNWSHIRLSIFDNSPTCLGDNPRLRRRNLDSESVGRRDGWCARHSFTRRLGQPLNRQQLHRKPALSKLEAAAF